LIYFKLLGQLRKGLLAFNGFQGNLGLESRGELTTRLLFAFGLLN
jgi:hypothetical protein